MTTRVLYKSSVRKDLKNMDPQEAKKVVKQIEDVLVPNPRSGEALTGISRASIG